MARSTRYHDYLITVDDTSPLGRVVHLARPNGERFGSLGGGNDTAAALRKRAQAAIDKDLQRRPTIGEWIGVIGPMQLAQRGASIVVTFADGGTRDFPDAPAFWAHAYTRGWKPAKASK